MDTGVLSKSIARFCIVVGISVSLAGYSVESDEPKPVGPSLRQLLMPDRHGVFIPVPLVPQSRNFTCGPAALQSILTFYGDYFTEGQLQQLLNPTPVNGTSSAVIENFILKTLNDPAAKVKALCTGAPDEAVTFGDGGHTHCSDDKVTEAKSRDSLGYKVDFTQYSVAKFHGIKTTPSTEPYSPEDGETDVPSDGLTVKQLVSLLHQGLPVLVLIQAWPGSSKPPGDWRDKNENGHYVVVVGYDSKNFYLMDPIVAGNWSFIPRIDFVRRWHDLDTIKVGDKNQNILVRHFGMVIARKRVFDFFDAPMTMTK